VSTIKSSDEHLTLNADGASKDIKFQANGVEKASISSSGAFTSTTIDATKLTGTIPNFTSTGIDDNADATAITITSAERIGINHTTPEARLEIDGGSETGLFVKSTVAGEYPAIFQSASTGSVPITDFRNNGGNSQLQVLSDGRGLSQFTAKAWCMFDSTPTIQDSHNISSVTDSGVGNFRVNFSNNLANAAYAAVGTASNTSGSHNDNLAVSYEAYNTASTAAWLIYRTGNTSQADPDRFHSVYFGD
jgi:hypothetical protein